MNVLLVRAAFILSAASSMAQGTVVFDNNVPGVVVTHVYFDPAVPARLWVGNGPNDTPPGSREYIENGMSPITGPRCYAQLFAAPGADQGSRLRAASPITTFRTGDEAGFVTPFIATLDGVLADAPVATLRLYAWVVGGGERGPGSWDEATTRGWPWAASPAFNVYAIGGATNPPPYLTGLQSFSLGILIDSPPPPPILKGMVPTNGAAGVSRTAPVVFTFSATMNSYRTRARFSIPLSELPVISTWNDRHTMMTCTPVAPFPAGTEISWNVQGSDIGGTPLTNPPALNGSFTTGSAPVCMNPAVSGTGFSFDVLSSTGQLLTVQYRASLLSGSWQTLLTTNSPGDIVRINDPRPLSNPGMFYRVTSP